MVFVQPQLPNLVTLLTSKKRGGKVRADIPAMLGHKTAVWYAWEHRERRGRGGGHKEEVPLLKRFVAEKIRC